MFFQKKTFLCQPSALSPKCPHLVFSQDEVHDRKILGDLLLLVMRHSMEKHGNLKVILLSTPTDVGIFQRYFSNSKVVHIRNQRLPQNSQSSLQSVQSVYLDEILMRLTTCSFPPTYNGEGKS